MALLGARRNVQLGLTTWPYTAKKIPGEQSSTRGKAGKCRLGEELQSILSAQDNQEDEDEDGNG